MTGLTYHIDVAGFDAAARALNDLVGFDRATLLSVAIAVPLGSTHERLRETKAAPDGTPWAAWSEDYAQTRHGGHSLLMNEGDLDDSITEFVSGDLAGVGSNLVYAAIQQFGGEAVDMDIPARPYLGLTDEDAREIEGAVIDYMGSLVR